MKAHENQQRFSHFLKKTMQNQKIHFDATGSGWGGHGSRKALSRWKVYGKFVEIIYGKAWVAGWVWVVAMAGPVWKELDH